MTVETHAFKEAFVQGEVHGFVVCTEPPPTVHRHFAEIYGTPDRYHIFETRAAAEFQKALAATGSPPRDNLDVAEVRVENIRDYQSLAGVKTVFLIDREGRATQSLRIGDMPWWTRTNTPFPRPLPPEKPAAATAPKSRIRATLIAAPKTPDPYAHVPVDTGEEPCTALPPPKAATSSPPDSAPPGLLTRLFRAFFSSR
jgi:hypothetical protein